jgi:very-short-patch-repair endonuclease
MVEFRRRPTLIAQKLRNTATDAERLLWRHLSRRQLGGYKFSRQMPVGPYICDFMCRQARLAIEVDGGQHDAREPIDQARTKYLASEGFRVLRFWNNEVLETMEGVLIRILQALDSAHPQPLPQARGA